MEKSSNASRRNNRGIEENTMAILDASGVKDTQDADDDMMAFLEAVRLTSLVAENGTAPTSKMFVAIFQILKQGKSLELMMTSYQLLLQLDKHFPRVHISYARDSNRPCEVVVVKEAWSPFFLGMDVVYTEREADNACFDGSLDPPGFHTLIQDISELAKGNNSEALDTKYLGKMLLFQYLTNVLEGDFLPRNSVYKETTNWTLVRESIINTLLASRRISYKGLIRDCLSIMCELCSGAEDLSAEKPFENSDAALAISIFELERCTCVAVQKLLMLIVELDLSKKKAELEGCTTRGDGIRTPLVETVLDELTYNKDMLAPFLQVLDEPKLKLEIVLQYFSKYTIKPAVRTRQLNDSRDYATFDGVLKCLSNATSARSIIKKISTEVAQLLLAHAFQAYLSLSPQHHHVQGNTDSTEAAGCTSLVKICESLISAFEVLRRVDEQGEVLACGKEALFTAATILSKKSAS